MEEEKKVIPKVTNPRVFLDIQIASKRAGQIVIELRRDIVGKTCENFLELCKGGLGLSETGFELSYEGCEFHRIIPNEVCQCGDFTKRDGTGGESIFGPQGFVDESFALRHVGPGILSMVNSGPDSNQSQFFITFAKMPSMDYQNVVFGYVVEGMEVLRKIEACGTPCGRPTQKVSILSCGFVAEFG
mmetsp:Transcript_42402/g.68081  ORF Transcript_42402/g.68081 Transcript_42402/m.68081 type:complete len:187 (+) Transcript_42402:672-1232(+)